MSTTKDTIRTFILHEFLAGEDPQALRDDTPLVTGGILDSLATIQLVAFIEEQFDIQLQAHEVDAEFLDTLDRIAGLVHVKRGSS